MEARLAEHTPERSESKAALADVLVTVEAAAERALGIVQMEGDDPPDADRGVESGEHRVEAGRRAEVVARGEGVLRVETHAEPLAASGLRAQTAELLEAPADLSPLPGRVLERDRRPEPTAGGENLAQRTRRRADARVVARAAVGPGMRDQVRDAEALAAFELGDELAHPPLAERRDRRRDVEEVAVVGEQRVDAGRSPRGGEGAHLVLAERAARPLSRRAGEDLHRLAPRLATALEGEVEPARDRLVRAEKRPGTRRTSTVQAAPWVQARPPHLKIVGRNPVGRHRNARGTRLYWMPMDADFLDVRTHGFARVAVCVPETRVADPAFNAEAHLRVLEEVYRAGAQYALCPELGLSSYTCGDLFLQETLLAGALGALRRVADATARWNTMVSVGMPLVVDDLLFNCAVTLYAGRPVAVAPKAHPPNYREFYELRWFHPAAEARATEIELLGMRVPFGTDVLVRAPHVPGFVLHTDICEDLWTPVPPGTIAALSGATVLANLSASNVTVGKWEYRKDLVRSSSAKNLAVQMYSAAGFGESTSDLAWDGHGLVAERGELVAETRRFALRGETVVVDVDLVSLAQDRLRQGSWGQNAAVHGRPLRAVDTGSVAETRDPALFRELRRRIEPQPFVPADPQQRDVRCREIFLIKSTSLARRLLALPEDARRVVIGISGGQDSTEALLVATHAMDLLGLPRARILGVTMPGFGTSKQTHANARALVRALGATLREIDIKGIADRVFEAIGHDPGAEDVTFENVQAWTRKFLLFALASEERGIDLGTGDLSELALGFATYGGDHMSHYGVNAGVPKTLISYLIRWAAETVFEKEPEVARVLASVLATPISPELLRLGAEGAIAQKSEEIVGPYELHDFFLYWLLRFGFGPRRIARMAVHAFAGRHALADIRRWLLVFLQRFFQNQFKRDCLPDAPKVGSGGSLSPRGDWRMPSDASLSAWLSEAEAIPAAEQPPTRGRARTTNVRRLRARLRPAGGSSRPTRGT